MTTTTEKVKFTWQACGPRESIACVKGRNYDYPWPDASIRWSSRGGKQGWTIKLHWACSSGKEVSLPPSEFYPGSRASLARNTARKRGQELLTMVEPKIRELHGKLATKRRWEQDKRDAQEARETLERALRTEQLEALNRRFPELAIEPSNIPFAGSLAVVDLGRLTKLLARLDPA